MHGFAVLVVTVLATIGLVCFFVLTLVIARGRDTNGYGVLRLAMGIFGPIIALMGQSAAMLTGMKELEDLMLGIGIFFWALAVYCGYITILEGRKRIRNPGRLAPRF